MPRYPPWRVLLAFAVMLLVPRVAPQPHCTSCSPVGRSRVAAPTLSAGMTWEVCDDGSSTPGAPPMLQPDAVILTPDPPHHGRTMVVDVSGPSPRDVYAGSLSVSVVFHGITVFK